MQKYMQDNYALDYKQHQEKIAITKAKEQTDLEIKAKVAALQSEVMAEIAKLQPEHQQALHGQVTGALNAEQASLATMTEPQRLLRQVQHYANFGQLPPPAAPAGAPGAPPPS